MIEEGQLVFSGTMDEFNNYIQPNSFVVVLKNPPRMTELEHVPGVSRVEAINSKSFRVWFDTDDDVTARMVHESVSRGWELSEVSVERSSLDEVFARLSGKSKRES